jgi:hypothetical protein
MAAHVKTGVEQILAGLDTPNPVTKSIIEGAVNLSCFTEDDFNVWNYLYTYVHSTVPQGEADALLKSQLTAALRRLDIEWLTLGRPATREAWLEAKYNSGVRQDDQTTNN